MQPHLERVALPAGEILIAAGDAVGHVYFPTAGLVSMFACNGRGKTIEVALVGREGATGVPDPGPEHSPGLESVVHVAGMAGGSRPEI